MSDSMFDPKYRAKSSSSVTNDFGECNPMANYIEADRADRDNGDDVCCISNAEWERVWRKKKDFHDWQSSSGDTWRLGNKRR